MENEKTVELFEFFYRNVKDAADNRGKNGSAFNYWMNSSMVEILHDVLQLLNREKPRKPIRIQREREYPDGLIEKWGQYCCPRCKRTVAKKYSAHYQRCMFCGQALDWKDYLQMTEVTRYYNPHVEPGQKKGE